MNGRLREYAEIVGSGYIDELRIIADRLRGKRFQHINSTAVGGGVAEILTRMVPMLRELGVDTAWDTIKGSQAFFEVTQAFHNALHGRPGAVTAEMFDIFQATAEMNCREMSITGDIIMVHDPEPICLVNRKADVGRKWIWRCHLDVSTPNTKVWNFLRDYVEDYDATIFSMPDFAQKVTVPQYMVPPSIDPLSDRNRELDDATVEAVLEKYGIDPSRPILIQVSRFDRMRDPLGVVASYRKVKRRHDCQLVLATADPTASLDGAGFVREVQREAERDSDIHVLELPPFSDLDINALVRGSTVVIQKSIREGFGLGVSEALWKKKPVIGGAAGAIKPQVVNGVTGYLVHSPEGAATRALQLLADAPLRARMGENGHEHVRRNFLLTRHAADYLLAMLALYHPNQDMVNL